MSYSHYIIHLLHFSTIKSEKKELTFQ